MLAVGLVCMELKLDAFLKTRRVTKKQVMCGGIYTILQRQSTHCWLIQPGRAIRFEFVVLRPFRNLLLLQLQCQIPPKWHKLRSYHFQLFFTIEVF